MATELKFSVLLPTRNGGDLLRGAISSVLGQEENIELVVADNANTDQTAAVVDAFSRDPRLKVIRHERPVSVTENWTSAVDASTGDYIVLIGDDDYLLPGYFSSLRHAIERDNPDCIVYNGYSYVFPGAVLPGAPSYYADSHFHFDAGLRPGVLDHDYRIELLRNMFSFRVRYPLNAQLTMFSRRAMERLMQPFFRAPFPDHFAVNALLLKAERFVYFPAKLLVVGLSPKSFGHYAYGGLQAEGMSYLGSPSVVEGRLPGSELTNSMYSWLQLLQAAYPGELRSFEIDRGAYVRRQAAFWLVQHRRGAITTSELATRIRNLSWSDRIHLAYTMLDREAWKRLPRLMPFARGDQVRTQWSSLKPLPAVSNIEEFARWITKRRRALDRVSAGSVA